MYILLYINNKCLGTVYNNLYDCVVYLNTIAYNYYRTLNIILFN